ncbi:MAG: orotate phosphoribosyltransferase [Nitrospirae bacterium]|nr:orotate phosphoribosyltransferase [Nitrospirota bacterium]
MTENASVKNNEETQERIWGMLCHLTALLGLVGIPFGNIFGPLLVWLYKKNAYAFVDLQGRESLNFQITMTILVLVAALLIYLKIGMMLIFVLASINVVLVLIASVRAYRREPFSYPFQIRFFK